MATTTDIDRVQESLNNSSGTLRTLQKSQADLISKMDQLDRSLASLREKLDDNQKRMTTFSQKLDDTQARLGSRMELISRLLSQATTQATVPVPGELYRTAYADYQSGKLDLAISGFKSFIERYPSSDLADSAQFYMADSYLAKKNFTRAREEFDKILSLQSDYRPQALLKRSYALAESGQAAAQKETLETLVRESPSTPEAQTAKQILQELVPPAPEENPAPAPQNKKAP